jgi:hypothetical protein
VTAAKNNNVGIVRRISGGGAVYHENVNEITYAVICSESDIRNIFKTYQQIYHVPMIYQLKINRRKKHPLVQMIRFSELIVVTMSLQEVWLRFKSNGC